MLVGCYDSMYDFMIGLHEEFIVAIWTQFKCWDALQHGG